jgi:hypothetical protein
MQYLDIVEKKMLIHGVIPVKLVLIPLSELREGKKKNSMKY